MIRDREFEYLFRREFGDSVSNLIWQTQDGEYEVFGRYRIVKEVAGYRVFCSETNAGLFATTRSALSWCIADKNCAYNTAREVLDTDRKLAALTADIATRAAIGDRSRDPVLRETILTKLETKILQKKRLENQLSKCVDWAKYVQQRGFQDETARTGRNQPNKASR